MTHRINLGIWILGSALAAFTGGMLTLGCERREEPADVSAAAVREETRESGRAGDYTKQQLAELRQSAEAAERDAKRDLEEAREKVEQMPEEAQQQLSAAIDRTESARDNLSDRLDELESATEAHWDETRQRVSDALAELAEARSEVAAALRGERSTG